MRVFFYCCIYLCFTFVANAQIDTLAIEKHIERLIDSSTTNYTAGNYVKSLKYDIEIIENAQKIQHPEYLHKGYRFLGYNYLILEDIELAKVNIEKAAHYAKLINDDKAIAKTYMDLGGIYAYTPEDYSKATSYHDESIELFKKLNDTTCLSKAYYNTVLTMNKNNHYDDALPYLKNATALISTQDDHFKRKLNNEWATYYLEKEDYKKADTYIYNILKDTTNGLTSLELESVYEKWSYSLFKQKKYKKAYAARIKYETYNFESKEKTQNASSQQISAKFQIDEYKKNIEKRKLQNQLQVETMRSKERFNNFLVTVILASILFIIILYLYYYNRRSYIKLLKQKNQEYFEAKKESERLSKSKSEFFSTVSHELRTPLYGVIGLSTILMEDPALKSHEQDIKSLKFSADYLLALINDVLQISKIDSGRLENNEDSFEIRQFIKNIVSSFEYMRLQNKNVIHIKIDEEVPDIIVGDATRLSQILMNLIGNALKFTENGTINVILESVLNTDNLTKICFIIKDTGIGIPKKKLASIFDEFSQVSTRHYTYQGTGLGLPIVKKLLNLSDTEISVDSVLGEGSSFYFTLLFNKDSTKIPSKKIVILNEETLEGKNILIVDDNRINQIVTSKILQKSNVICEVANNGKEAVEKALSANYDLILMDINMPVMNGIEATQEIRKHNTNIPIIALTAVEIKEMRTKIYDSGMTDIIIKPYDISKFKNTILRNLS